MKDDQTTGEASSPQKRTPSTSKHEIFSFFKFYYCGAFSLLPLRIWNRNQPSKSMQIPANLDPHHCLKKLEHRNWIRFNWVSGSGPGGQKSFTKVEKIKKF